MNMIRVSHHDLPNPAKRIAELESELLRVRAALDEARADAELQQKNITFKAKQLIELRAELAEAHELDNKQHAAIVRDTLEIGELEAERDALRARLQAVETAARWACESWPARSENWIRADHEDAMEALTAALAGSETTK